MERLAEKRRLAESEGRGRLLELKYQKIFHATPDAVTVTLPREGGVIVDVNDAFERITGWSREEAIGRTTLDLGLFLNPANRGSLLEEVEQTGLVRNHELDIRTKAGNVRRMSLSASTLEGGAAVPDHGHRRHHRTQTNGARSSAERGTVAPGPGDVPRVGNPDGLGRVRHGLRPALTDAGLRLVDGETPIAAKVDACRSLRDSYRGEDGGEQQDDAGERGSEERRGVSPFLVAVC
jgi:PAS domain S-box-containing protein